VARLAFALLAGVGILGIFLPLTTVAPGESLWESASHNFVYQVGGGFIVAFLAGALGSGFGIARWSALIAAVAFGFVISLFWNHIEEHIKYGGIGARLMMAGALGGIVGALIEFVFPPPD
jgi:hypothetical protein